MGIFLMKAGAAPAAPQNARAAKQPATRILAQFGNDLVVATPSARGRGRPRGAGVAVAEAAGSLLTDADPARLRLVVQKGRLFNREHPNVPVLLDRGRYQLIEIDPAREAELAGDHCYEILPLDGGIKVFEEIERRLPRDSIPEWEDAIVAAIDPVAFTANIDALCAFENRHSLGKGFKKAQAVAKARFDGFGFETRIDPIDIRKPDGKLAGKSSNLVALKSGAGMPPRSIVLVTAHLDSVNEADPFDPSLPAPGADDNGSGSAGAMEMARVLASHPAVHDVMFILFGGEEEGLFGSQQFVAAMSAGDRSRLRAVVNMDMIGVVNKPPQMVLLEGGPVSQHVMDGLHERAGAHTSLRVRQSLRFAASDHVPFINAGLAAVLTIEGDDEQNKTIHTPNDTKDKVTADYAAEILRMNVGYVASLLGRVTPS